MTVKAPVSAPAPVGLLLLLFVMITACGETAAPPAPVTPAWTTRTTLDLSGDGWSLWLDESAVWEDDRLHLPGFDLGELPVRAPSGDWGSLDAGRPVSVPGTVEEYVWDERGGDYRGVSWWSRTIELPAVPEGRRAVLCFEAVRLRAEVFLDEQLVGYDAVGNTPFEVDVTEACRVGGEHRLAVRVTDPGGNFDWRDYDVHFWGEQSIPASHGFGGVSGPVRLELRDTRSVAALVVRNTPAIKDVLLVAMLDDPALAAGDTLDGVRWQVLPADADGPALFDAVGGSTVLQGPEGLQIRTPVSVPDAVPWSLENPALYRARVTLPSGDAVEARFGFRWFAIDGQGDDAVLRLNGRRVVLRSAISWGFWPVTGLVPTPELAVRQVRSAQALGLNMLNHHRTLAAPGLLDVHDELGLLAYEEPGGYWSNGGDELCFALAREKWLRMIKRDRNHPSLVIFNMINESKDVPGERFFDDLRAAQQLDPTRLMTYTSAWSADDDPALCLYVRPGEPGLHRTGWWDQHNAPGPGVDRDEHWRNPNDYLRRSTNRPDVVFWGEDGAIATPPRLARVAEDVRAAPRRGWDGTHYLGWAQAYEDYLDAKGWRDAFPDLDALTGSLGNISHRYQAGVIQNIRLGDVADGYVVNGWEGSKLENHSGIVDGWRHPKGDPALLAEANAPLALVVKLRQRVMHVGTDHGDGIVSPAAVVSDIYLLNEGVLDPGRYTLLVGVADAEGEELRRVRLDVAVAGGRIRGDLQGQPLTERLRVLVEGDAGHYKVQARLIPLGAAPDAEPIVRGESELFLVDWKSRPVPEGGALVSTDGIVAHFLNVVREAGVPRFDDSLPPLRWVVADHLDPEPKTIVPAEVFATDDGERGGLTAAYYDGVDFDEHVLTRTDPGLDWRFSDDGPLPETGGSDYSIRWTGQLHPPEAGIYRFHTEASGGVRVWVDGRLVLEDWTEHGPQREASAAVELDPARPVDVRVDYFQGSDNSRVRLYWTTPEAGREGRALLEALTRRVADDGTTLLVLGNADGWTRLLADAGVVESAGVMTMGRYWLGGNFFVRDHPLFAGLPVNGAMDWEYQQLVHYGLPTYGLRLQGEEAVVACVTGHRHEVATAVGVVPHGAGRILLCTLDLPRGMPGPPGPSDVPKALLMNFLEWAADG